MLGHGIRRQGDAMETLAELRTALEHERNRLSQEDISRFINRLLED